MKHFLSWILALALLLGLVPMGVSAVEETGRDTIGAIVEQTIRSYAASLSQNNAADNAASALAKHGLSGGGKTLKVGAGHPLTAVLMSSEMMQNMLIDSCTEAILVMQQTDLESLPNTGASVVWYENDFYYYSFSYTTTPHTIAEQRDIRLAHAMPYTGPLNSYDQALVWMVGNTGVEFQFQKIKVTAEEVTYRVTATTKDRFDFSTSKGSGFSKLISGLGALLFREFDWNATVTFDLTVPYSCTHSWGSYHWHYDSANKQMVSETDGSFLQNTAAVRTSQNSAGQTTYYYELSETVRLYHDAPWVVEYDTSNPNTIVLVPFEPRLSYSAPGLVHLTNESLFLKVRTYHSVPNGSSTSYHHYGILFDQDMVWEKNRIYTFRLENRPDADGTNMIYLTVSDRETGNVLVADHPMDDYYFRKASDKEYEPVSSEDNWVSGKDCFINFIGNQQYPFRTGYFDLRIWENVGSEPQGSYCTTQRTDPTCTQTGECHRSCPKCGYSFPTETLPALGHIPGEEATCMKDQTCTICNAVLNAATGHAEIEIPAKKATCENDGSTAGKKCADCNEILVATTEIPALGHQFYAGTCTLCGAADPNFLPGDANGDGKLDYNDALLVLRASIGLETLSAETSLICDLNRNGKLDYTDALTILRTFIGLSTAP